MRFFLLETLNYNIAMPNVTLGTITKTFGLKGEVLVLSNTDYGKDRFKKGKRVFLVPKKEGEPIPFKVRSYRDSGNYYYLGLEGIDTIEKAQEFIGFTIEIPLEEAPMPPHTYRISDLLGCKVLSQDGEELGKVVDVTKTATTPNLKIQREKKAFYVPFKEELFVKKVDIENKTITIEVMEGLL